MKSAVLVLLLLLGVESRASDICILTLATTPGVKGSVMTLLETCDGSKSEVVARGSSEMVKGADLHDILGELPVMLTKQLSTRYREGLRPANGCDIKVDNGFLSQGVGLYCLLVRQ